MANMEVRSNGTRNMFMELTVPDGFSSVSNFTEKESFSLMGNVSTINKEPVYYNHAYSVASMVLYTAIFVSGIMGNIMVICVISRSKNMKTATNCYLLSLAVADCLILISATLPAIAEPLYQIKEWPWGGVMCSGLVFLQYLGINASTLSIAAFTIERYIGICHPMKAHVICSVNRAKRIIAILWVLSVSYCSPWLGLTYTFYIHSGGKKIEVCYYRLERNQYFAYYLTDLVFFYVIPLIIAAVMYACIARTLFKTMTNSNRQLLNGRRQSEVSKQGRDSSNKSRANSKFQVVRMLIVIVSVFGLTWLPYRSLVVYNSLSGTLFLNYWYLLFCRSLIYMNSAINPVLYSAMSIKFRRAFRNCLCCRADSTSVNTVHNHRSFYTVETKRNHHLVGAKHSTMARSGSNSSTPSFETQLLLRQTSNNGMVQPSVIPTLGTSM